MVCLDDMLIKVEESVRSGGSADDADLSIILWWLLLWLEEEEDEEDLEL